MPKTTEPTAGYDDAGNMTVYELAPGETLPPGVHPKPPPGTHPHERELAKAPAPPPALPIAETFAQYQERVGTRIEGPHPLDIPEPLRRKPGRPPKPRP